MQVKIRKKALKKIAIAVSAIIFLVFSINLLLQNSSVQTYIAQVLTKKISQETGAEVEIKTVKISFFNSILINGLLIKDQKKDTLLFAKSIWANLWFDYGSRKIDFKNIQIDSAFIHVKRLNENEYNFSFLINHEPQKTKSNRHFEVSYRDLSLNGSRILYDYVGKPEKDSVIDFNHLKLSNVGLEVQQLKIDTNSVSFNLEQLNFKSQKGLQVVTAMGNIKISPDSIFAENLELVTPQTHLSGNVKFKTKKYKDYADFLNSVRIEIKFNSSEIGLSDLGYFVPQWYHFYQNISFSGNINGTISRLNATNLTIALKGGTTFKGAAHLRGLPDIGNTFIHLKVSDLSTTSKKLAQFSLLNIDKSTKSKLLQTADKLGNIRFKGDLTGFVNDFVAYGNFSTGLGNLSTDLALKNIGVVDKKVSYSGKIKTKKFAVGKFLGNQNFGYAGLNISVRGAGLSADNIEDTIDGKINYWDFKGYRYKNITANGRLKKRKFNGDVKISDPNLALQFNGNIDLSKKIPKMAFVADIQKAKLKRLGFVSNVDSSTDLSAKLKVNFSGFDFNSIQGNMSATQVYYSDSEMKQKINTINLKLGKRSDNQRFLTLNSDLADVDISGNYNLSDFPEDFKNIMGKYFSNRGGNSRFTPTHTALNFKVQLKNTKLLSHLFLPKLKIGDNTSISGQYISGKNLLHLQGHFTKVQYAAIKFQSGKLNINNKDDSLKAEMISKEISYNDSTSIHNFSLKSNIFNSHINSHLHWDNHKDSAYKGNIYIAANINSDSTISASINHSEFDLRGYKWTINDGNYFVKNDSSYFIKNFVLHSVKNTYIKVSGTASGNKNDRLKIKLEHFNLSGLNRILAHFNTKIAGTINGTTTISSIFSQPIFAADFTFDSLGLNNLPVGSGNIKSVYHSRADLIELSGNFRRADIKVFSFSGDYYIHKKNNNLDINLTFNKTPAKLAENYLKLYVSDMTGTASGKIAVTGSFKQPKLKGKLSFDNTAFTINYLNTHYRFGNGSVVNIAPGAITADNLKLYDTKNNLAFANVTIFHNNFKNPNFNIGIYTNNHPFTFLNTQYDEKNSYYGKAVLSGMADISGYANQIMIDAHLKSEDGTNIYIPVSDETDITNNNFVVFTKNDSLSTDSNIETKDKDYADVTMNFDLEATRNANVHIIFGGPGGDILNASGDGRINLKISDRDGFKMYGKYTIQQGSYVFSLKNIIKKRLSLERGSYINWTGSPYRANIDVHANYQLRASLQDIINDPTSRYAGQRVPVVVEMHMFNQLQHPDIGFNIKLPSVDDATKEMVKSILFVNDNEENKSEMNRQVFALLMLRKFLPPAGSENENKSSMSKGFGAETTSQLLSNQISNWLSQISNKVNVGFKYTPSENELQNDEMELGLSTQLFDNRVVLNGNVGYVNSNDLNSTRNQFVGEFNVAYLITKDGNLRAIFFNHSNNDYFFEDNSKYTQGVGLHYRLSFDKLKDIFKKDDDSKPAGNKAEKGKKKTKSK